MFTREEEITIRNLRDISWARLEAYKRGDSVPEVDGATFGYSNMDAKRLVGEALTRMYSDPNREI